MAPSAGSVEPCVAPSECWWSSPRFHGGLPLSPPKPANSQQVEVDVSISLSRCVDRAVCTERLVQVSEAVHPAGLFHPV